MRNVTMMRHFEYEHLRGDLQEVSKQFHDLAHWIDQNLVGDEETTVALRKLLEAKDAAVRSAVAFSAQSEWRLGGEINAEEITASSIIVNNKYEFTAGETEAEPQVLGAIARHDGTLVFTVTAKNAKGETQTYEVEAENSIDAAFKVMNIIKGESNG